ncbi:phosphonate ABC transporter ATP-binding protein [Fructobacillus sp. M1-13]|uniref:Phosphonate ABC transporter ATP-binding protein n=1 Tax=Fructobacillus papyriferae TaxID=2713171 RepID=A0ABS5QR18_9LACO|nr:phosphonate ABC transporter ATP-binding protein [Fructobacillus papyriferae]MBS9335267.1 phosphonate ABC transporter ATP-binding protein [Fructobacillus papyriferae]MCD2159064.1 phosphonate ABC transporter ATP-binding protein [Fructobacillus papyriferae]
MTENKGNIEIKNVSKVYPNGTIGLKDINLDIKQGEFVMIVGLSGSGKSTLLRAINRLHDVTEGEILIDGQNITKATGDKLHKIRRSTAMIFQNYNLVKTSSVYRNVMSGRVGYYPAWKAALGLFTKEDQEMVKTNLSRVNLLDKYYVKARDLSGGQQQRVGIARALMQEPSVILADEPVSGLDPKTTKQVMNDLKKLNEEDGMTIVLNVHSIGLALKYSSRIVGLKDGRIIYDKPIEEVDKRDFKEIYREAGDDSHLDAGDDVEAD